MVRRTQVAVAACASWPRRGAPRPSRRRCRSSSATRIRALSDAEQDSKELKSAKRQALVERILAELQLPFPARRRGRVLDAARRARAAVKAAIDAIYKQIVRTKIAVEKRRPDGRSENEIRQVTCAGRP